MSSIRFKIHLKYHGLTRKIPLMLCGYLLAGSTLLADVTVPASQVDQTIYKIKAGHFLSQATMGALPYQINGLATRMQEIGEDEALNEWIDTEFAKPYQSITALADNTIAQDGFDGEQITGTTGTTGKVLKRSIIEYQQMMWWDRAIRGHDQLRQRTAWALIQIFVTSGNADNGRLAARWRQPLTYYDVLLENAFTNYRDLIEDVTYHPFMGFYLSHLKNTKGDPENGIFPDENYAREILQLFSMGVYKLRQNGTYFYDAEGNPIENYDNETIKEYAKVFTGLTYAPTPGVNRTFFGMGRNYTAPMMMFDEYHDTSEKKLLGVTLPAGQGGDQDISDTLDNIASNRSVAPYLARMLIQRFTSSNPSSGYIFRVTRAWDDTNGVRGDMKGVIRAILMDAEARNSLSITQIPQGNNVLIKIEPVDELHGKIKEPVLMMAQFLRRYIPISQESSGTLKPMPLSGATMQKVLRAPSVFNYYSSEYAPGNGPLYDATLVNNEDLVAPEAELLPISAIPFFEGLLTIARNEYLDQKVTDTSVPAAMTRLTASKSVERDISWLVNDINLNLCYGSMPESLKTQIADIMNNDSIGNYDERFSRAMAVILTSADYAVTH